MSAVGSGDVLKPILLRSSTPAPNEKVLKYLEGMSREGVDTTPPRSVAGSYRSKAKSTRSAKSASGGSKVFGPTNGRNGDGRQLHDVDEASYEGDSRARIEDDYEEDDADSDIQVGKRSENGTALPEHEPGPSDPPGPRYESYDSGPSFGNFGPLPQDPNLTWQADKPKPWGSTASTTPNAAKMPLPPSVASPRGQTSNLAVNIPPPTPKSRSTSKARSSVTENKSVLKGSESPTKRDQGPMSPVSAIQSLQTQVERTTEKGAANYPPLPSAMGDTYLASPSTKSNLLLSPRFKVSKAQSISPSDSPSQMKPSKSQGRPPPSPATEVNGARSVLSGAGGNYDPSRPFSPFRHLATNEDLLHAAARGRALMTPPPNDKVSNVSTTKPSSPSKKSVRSNSQVREIPAQSARPHSPVDLTPREEEIIRNVLAKTPRTSMYGGSVLEPEVVNSRFHDMELCVLFHQECDPAIHDVVKKAIRKELRRRVKALGLKYDNQSIDQFRNNYHNHNPSVHLDQEQSLEKPNEPPEWAKALMEGMARMQQNIDGLGPKIDELKSSSYMAANSSRFNADDPSHTQATQTVDIRTNPTGAMAESMFRAPESEEVIEEHNRTRDEGFEFDDDENRTEKPNGVPYTDGETQTRGQISDFLDDNRDDSPGQQFLEEELYKLRKKPQGSQSEKSHRTWELAREDDDPGEYDDEEPDERYNKSNAPTIPDTAGAYTDRRGGSPPLPPLPNEGRQDMVGMPQQQSWHTGDYSSDAQPLPPWQRIHQRLLSWAIIWPMSELDAALNSTTRGHQVDEVALSIWSTQTYKRYVRARLTDSPQGMVDRLFVPPNMADAISNAVFNGRHGDACGMLRDLWTPFGLDGMPRLLVVLAKHRSDENHWVVHRFSLPDGSLTTYDSHPERAPPDGRPLGWWFAIRVAWPNAIYPSPETLVQKMVRLHRPMQLNIDNSVAAAGIWRNILMGSRAERSLDLERLRDLINTEVKNLRQRKHLGKLSIGAPRPTWEDMN